MRPLVRSYGVISIMTLSPVNTRMRFLRILPAVWAMISWPFCRSTRKVALGKSSLTVPSNSSNSSLAIRPLQNATANRSGFPSRRTRKVRQQRPGDCIEPGQNQGFSAESQGDLALERVPDGTIGGPALFLRALNGGGIGGLPMLDRDRRGPGPVLGAILGFLRQDHDQVEAAVLQIFETVGAMGERNAD